MFNNGLFVADSDTSIDGRVTTLENNEYKVAYFAEIASGTSGTITIPTGATILLDQLPNALDAILSTMSGTGGQPTGNSPVTAAGAVVAVSSFDTAGNYTLSGTPRAYPVALIYLLKIKAKDWANLTTANILEYENSENPAPQKIEVSNYTPVAGTAITAEELLRSLPVPANRFFPGDLMEVAANTNNNSSAGGKTYRMYINSSDTLVGATQIAMSTTITINQQSILFSRYFPVINDTTLECASGAGGAQLNAFSSGTGTSANVVVPSLSAAFFILITGTKTLGADTDGLRWAVIRNSKP